MIDFNNLPAQDKLYYLDKERSNYSVRQIPYAQVLEWLVKRHYAHRIPSISYAFGLKNGNEIIGVATFGIPASPSLCRGICGERYKNSVLEFNRLCLEDNTPRNSASFFIGRSIKLLPEPSILVSYADVGQGHIGYIYQATNWLYTGATKERTDIFTGEGKHSRHYDKKSDYSQRQSRSSKHRYIYFHGCSEDIKRSLTYPVLPYPKGNSQRYKADAPIAKQGILV